MHIKHLLKKQFLVAIIGYGCLSPAFAADNLNAAPEPTNAIAFAIQAGQIAGTAQACGVNISVFTMRVSEAINKLALNPTDSTAAINSFQQTLQRAQTLQTANHAFACSQVMQDFNSLPLLRPDYEQTVIAQLNPGMTNNNQTSNPASNANTPNNNADANTMPTQQNLTNQPAQNNATSNNNNSNNNPAYPAQNYGPMKSFSSNYSGAIKPYSMANQPLQQNNNGNNNTPTPPSFTNPNNTQTTYNNPPTQ